ncbi:hypothetical protein BT96DRAFT_24912 [Gymnopus androsaceus JB14]|uniref:Uncharacterized protein n=1 Tax=Gymnopus androsaceus JB14 TaxID=1447944 RepID=A0A6A4IHH0_9AGAR|nr:hypothetical protein BT96DRAFT_24912 [Gymnopus androsaceus JB14]
MADGEDQKQCRICFDGVESEEELGRLIRPCLCRGTISYVHVKCLQRWRTSSPNKSAFFSCPQCHYKYKFAARFWAVGIASNPLIIGCISAFIFALLTLASSYVTTYLLAYFQRPSSSGFYIFSSSYWFEDPVEAARDIVRAALGILQDENGVLFDARSRSTGAPSATTQGSPGFLARLIIGLPLLGASSLVQMLSFSLISPIRWLARRRRNNDSRDASALIIAVLICIGCARALYQVYRFTESISKRLLLRAEEIIVEV